jgi:hypothetical protein
VSQPGYKLLARREPSSLRARAHPGLIHRVFTRGGRRPRGDLRCVGPVLGLAQGGGAASVRVYPNPEGGHLHGTATSSEAAQIEG